MIGKLGDCILGKPFQNLTVEQFICKFEKILNRSATRTARITDANKVKAEIGDAYYVPWYVECHSERFPGWFGEADNRVVSGT